MKKTILILAAFFAILTISADFKRSDNSVMIITVYRNEKPKRVRVYTPEHTLPDSLEAVIHREDSKISRWYYPDR